MRSVFFGGAAFAVIAAISSEPAHSYDMPMIPTRGALFIQATVPVAPTAVFLHSNNAGRL